MLLQENLERYQRKDQSSFLKNIANILCFTALSLSCFYLCRYICFKTRFTFFLLLFSLIATTLFFTIKYFLKKRYANLSVTILAVVFFLISLLYLLFGQQFYGISFIASTISFVFLSFNYDQESSFWCFTVFLVITVTGILFINSEGLFVQSDFSSLYIQSKTLWLFFFLLFLLYERFRSGERRYRYESQSRIVSKDRLLAKISKDLIHDISTPLTVLSGSMRLLEDGELSPREVDNIKKTALHSLNYLENILDNSFMLLNGGQKDRKFFPNCIVKKNLFLLNKRLEDSKITIESDLKGCKKIYGNETFFTRVFLNILINSIEELEKGKKKEKTILLSSEVKEGSYYLTIRDNGMGMNRRVLDKVKQNGFTTKERNSLGLGLPFVSEIMENHFAGNVFISSGKGSFTKVVLKFPL